MMTTAERNRIKEYEAFVAKLREATEHDFNALETETEKRERIARALDDYEFFVTYYFKSSVAPHPCAPFHISTANLIAGNPHARLLLAWGRGLAKTTHFSLMVPLWLWAKGMTKVAVLISQNETKAKILVDAIRAQFEGNQLLIRDFGAQMNLGKWESGHFETNNKCAFIARGLGQDPRGIIVNGHRPDLIIADDCDTKEVCRNPKRLKRNVAYLCEEVLPLTSAAGSRYIQVNNIFAKETLLTKMRDERKGFLPIQQNATKPDGTPTWNYPGVAEYYAIQRQTMGTLAFESEYNNTPYEEGSIFTESMIVWDTPPPLQAFDRIISYWDVAYSDAKTADFNAVKVWGVYKGQFWLLDAFVRQCKMADAMRWMLQVQADYRRKGVKITFYFEAQFWNDAIAMTLDQVQQEFGGEILQLVKDIVPKQYKLDRIMQMLPYYQAGKIVYNILKKNHSDFHVSINQLIGIEPGYTGKDDSPDVDASALRKLAQTIAQKKTTYASQPRVKRGY